MTLDNHIPRIESLTETYIATKNKLDFTQLHGKIALSIYNTLKKYLGGQYKTEADRCIQILTISDPDQISGDEIDSVSTFFSSMILLHTSLKQKSKKAPETKPEGPFLGILVFAMASILIWAFSFLMTFGIENSTAIIILISVIGFVVVLKGKQIFGLGGDA